MFQDCEVMECEEPRIDSLFNGDFSDETTEEKYEDDLGVCDCG